MAPKPKKKSQTKQNALKPVNKCSKVSIWREAMNECIACITDSIFTQFCLCICYYLFYQIDVTQNYFKSPYHIYWIFYFVHVNMLDSYIWAPTFRNSVNYIYVKYKTQNIFKTVIIILCQYISVFIGVWVSIKCVDHYYFNNNQELAVKLKYQFVGQYEYPYTLNYDQYLQFIWQSLLFQLTDRFINGIIITISPLLKQKTIILNGQYMQVTFRCFIMHYLIINNRMGVVNNANYAFYACLYYWRWSLYDLIILILPYITILIWNYTFINLSFLHNPTYFQIFHLKKKKKQ